MTTDILAEIDDVLGQQVDLFDGLVDYLFPPIGVEQGTERPVCERTGVCAPVREAACWLAGDGIPSAALWTFPDYPCEEERVDVSLICHWLPWLPDLYRSGLAGKVVPLRSAVERAAYELGREMADQIRWQP